MKKRGFTLIELLAVIVILAIIALIATPMILGVIDSSKKGAFESSARGIIKAAESDFVKQQLTDSNLSYPYYYDLSRNTLEYKGKKFQNGVVILEADSTTILQATDNEYCANGTLTNLNVTKGSCQLSTVFYEALDFDNNTFDNAFYKKLDQVDLGGGNIIDLSNSFYQMVHNRLQLVIPEAEKNQPNLYKRLGYALEFTTPAIAQTYEISFEYEYEKEASAIIYGSATPGVIVIPSIYAILSENLSTAGDEETLLDLTSQDMEQLEPGIHTVRITKSLKANTKYYLMMNGPISIDSIHITGASLKGSNPYSQYLEDITKYEDPGVNAFNDALEDVSSQLVGIAGAPNNNTFAYRYFFQTKKGIQFIERTVQFGLSNFFDFETYQGMLAVSLKEGITDYTFEIFEGDDCSGANAFLPMLTLENNEPKWYYAGYYEELDITPRNECNKVYPKVRILKNGTVVKEESFLNIYQEWIQ